MASIAAVVLLSVPSKMRCDLLLAVDPKTSRVADIYLSICLPGGIAPEMLPGSNTRRLLEPWPRALVNVIIDPLLSGPKELKKVDSPVFAGLTDTQQHQITMDATLS